MTFISDKAEKSLGFLINRAARNISGTLRRRLQEAGIDLTSEQYGLLKRLSENDGQVQQDLAASWCKDKTSIARLLNGMENRHLIVRIANKSDRRVNHVYMTRDGREMLERCRPVANLVLEDAGKGFSPQEVSQLRDMLNRLHKNLSETPAENDR